MADRQTDKATNWAVTAYGEDILTIEDASGFPAFVKKVFGGREVCPTTQREHFQGHIQCFTQQRMSAIKKWLPRAHLEVARNVQASIAYSLKADTSSGEKKETVNQKPFVTDRLAMEKLVATCGAKCECLWYPKGDEERCFTDEKEDYWHRVRAILLDEPDLCGLYAKPDLYRLWKNTKSVWIARKRALDSITQSSNIIISGNNINARSEEVSSQSSKESSEETHAWHEGSFGHQQNPSSD